MNVITATRDSRCAACTEPIVQGERIVYERVKGALHLTCAEEYPGKRRNEHAATCHDCGVRVGIGMGELDVDEQPQPDGTYKRDWMVRCLVAGKEQCRRRQMENGTRVESKRSKGRLRRRLG